MSKLDKLKELLRRPLETELLAGCQDRVVAGGLSALMQGPAADPFPKVRELLSNYRQLRIAERKKVLQKALSLLEPEHPEPEQTQTVQANSTSPTHANHHANQLHLRLDLPVEQLNTGTGGSKKLKSLGLHTLRDVLHAYPRRHEDRRALPQLSQVQEGEKITARGKIIKKHRRKTKSQLLILEATLSTSSGETFKAVWFNQPWIERLLKVGSELLISGRAKRFGRGQHNLQISAEHLETIQNAANSLNIGRIVGIYEAKEGISQEFLRKTAYQALKTAPLSGATADYLPQHWRKKYDITNLPRALVGIHFPTDKEHLQQANRRLRFDEYLFLQLRILLQGEEAVLEGKRFGAKGEDLERFEAALPFTFTNAQRRVLMEITDDMRSNRQMARLIQGDVGSGKTAVAACALYLAVRDGYQGALMAPTEILARQHYQNLLKIMEPLDVRMGLLLGAMTPKQKTLAQAKIALGEVDIVVGTQALIQDSVTFQHLGLAVIDEEHRFGVEQRRKLLSNRPDVLVMSATPIPRSLALTAYGDLELSVIDELPPGRTPIETQFIGEHFRRRAYGFAMGQIRKGRQVYVVTALIEENENMELLAATQLADDLKTLLPDARIDLLHGKMNAHEKESLMSRFRAHEFDLLVSTTVVEVGVDVPNATLMIIENAERFGLAQLHQLRGRVGRGKHESYCLLIAGEHSKKTKQRLEIIENSTDGFVIAEADLKLRGPGELRGTRQAGMPDLRLADFANDEQIIEHARELAKHILYNDPKLEHPRLQYLRSELQNRSQSVAFREII